MRPRACFAWIRLIDARGVFYSFSKFAQSTHPFHIRAIDAPPPSMPPLINVDQCPTTHALAVHCVACTRESGHGLFWEDASQGSKPSPVGAGAKEGRSLPSPSNRHLNVNVKLSSSSSPSTDGEGGVDGGGGFSSFDARDGGWRSDVRAACLPLTTRAGACVRRSRVSEHPSTCRTRPQRSPHEFEFWINP